MRPLRYLIVETGQKRQTIQLNLKDVQLNNPQIEWFTDAFMGKRQDIQQLFAMIP
jgi:hypothetical protein